MRTSPFLRPLAALALLLSAPYFTACTGPAVLHTVPAPPPIAKAAAVQPLVVQATSRAQDLSRDLATLSTAAADARSQASAARAEAETLKSRHSATPAELDQLWQSLKSVEARNLFLEQQAADLTRSDAELHTALDSLQQAATDKDAEAAQLRTQGTTLRQTLDQANAATSQALQSRDQAETRARAAEEQAAKYKLIRNAAVLTAITLLVLFIAGLIRKVQP